MILPIWNKIKLNNMDMFKAFNFDAYALLNTSTLLSRSNCPGKHMLKRWMIAATAMHVNLIISCICPILLIICKEYMSFKNKCKVFK